MPLTAADIKNAAPAEQTYELPDGNGLVLRVLPSGTRSWCVWHYDLGRKRRATIGRYPAMGLREARSQCQRIKDAAVGEGAQTLSDFADEYMRSWAGPYKRSADQDQRILAHDIVPVIGDRPVVRVSRRDCADVIARIHARGAPDMAARAYALLRRVLEHAVERGIRDDNPARRMGVRQSPARDRVLGRSELATWWATLHDGATPESTVLALSLQLATGQRLGEVLGIAPGDLDLADRLWTIPRRKAKNGVTHTVPLTEWALAVITRARELWPHSSRLIRTTDDTVREHMRAVIERAGLERATPHDLRRTVATELASLGYSRTIQGRILNHKDRSVDEVYDRWTYDEEKRAALEHWQRHATEIISGTRTTTGPSQPEPQEA